MALLSAELRLIQEGVRLGVIDLPQFHAMTSILDPMVDLPTLAASCGKMAKPSASV